MKISAIFADHLFRSSAISAVTTIPLSLRRNFPHCYVLPERMGRGRRGKRHEAECPATLNLFLRQDFRPSNHGPAWTSRLVVNPRIDHRLASPCRIATAEISLRPLGGPAMRRNSCASQASEELRERRLMQRGRWGCPDRLLAARLRMGKSGELGNRIKIRGENLLSKPPSRLPLGLSRPRILLLAF